MLTFQVIVHCNAEGCGRQCPANADLLSNGHFALLVPPDWAEYVPATNEIRRHYCPDHAHKASHNAIYDGSGHVRRHIAPGPQPTLTVMENSLDSED